MLVSVCNLRYWRTDAGLATNQTGCRRLSRASTNTTTVQQQHRTAAERQIVLQYSTAASHHSRTTNSSTVSNATTRFAHAFARYRGRGGGAGSCTWAVYAAAAAAALGHRSEEGLACRACRLFSRREGLEYRAFFFFQSSQLPLVLLPRVIPVSLRCSTRLGHRNVAAAGRACIYWTTAADAGCGMKDGWGMGRCNLWEG